jgi:hypothetical protein
MYPFKIDQYDSGIKMLSYYKRYTIKEQGITNTEGEWGCQNRGIFLFNYIGFFIDYSVVA